MAAYEPPPLPLISPSLLRGSASLSSRLMRTDELLSNPVLARRPLGHEVCFFSGFSVPSTCLPHSATPTAFYSREESCTIICLFLFLISNPPFSKPKAYWSTPFRTSAGPLPSSVPLPERRGTRSGPAARHRRPASPLHPPGGRPPCQGRNKEPQCLWASIKNKHFSTRDALPKSPVRLAVLFLLQFVQGRQGQGSREGRGGEGG